MGFLFSEEKIEQMKRDWEAQHPEPPRPPTHAERLCALARANLSAKVRDLAFAAERSPSWVRRTLKNAGVVLIKPQKKSRLRIKASTPCAACGHPRGGKLATSRREQTHCVGGVRHLHWSNPASYVCTTRHCMSFNYDTNGQPVACECPDFVLPQPEQPEKGDLKS
jgi:hypothetical protein